MAVVVGGGEPSSTPAAPIGTGGPSSSSAMDANTMLPVYYFVFRLSLLYSIVLHP